MAPPAGAGHDGVDMANCSAQAAARWWPRGRWAGVLALRSAVTAFYLWVFGAFSLAYEPGRAETCSASLRHAATARVFWAAVTVAVVAALTAAGRPGRPRTWPRSAWWVFGLYAMYVAVVFPEGVYSAELVWLDSWARCPAPASGVISLLSLAGGFLLTRRTIVADLRARGTLTARVQRLDRDPRRRRRRRRGRAAAARTGPARRRAGAPRRAGHQPADGRKADQDQPGCRRRP